MEAHPTKDCKQEQRGTSNATPHHTLHYTTYGNSEFVMFWCPPSSPQAAAKGNVCVLFVSFSLSLSVVSCAFFVFLLFLLVAVVWLAYGEYDLTWYMCVCEYPV